MRFPEYFSKPQCLQHTERIHHIPKERNYSAVTSQLSWASKTKQRNHSPKEDLKIGHWENTNTLYQVWKHGRRDYISILLQLQSSCKASKTLTEENQPCNETCSKLLTKEDIRANVLHDSAYQQIWKRWKPGKIPMQNVDASELFFHFVVPIDGSSRARASATCRNIPSPVYHPVPLWTLQIYLFVILVDGIKRMWSSISMNRILFCMDSVSDAFGWRMFRDNGWMNVRGWNGYKR